MGCSHGFGSPSGHSTRSAFTCWVIILDLFFASSWARQKYSNKLTNMSVSTNKLAFAVISSLCIAFWLMNLCNRIYLGKHTLNQVILGSQLGIWCAFFSHFVLRDSILSHFTKLTNKEKELTRAQAFRYSLWGTFYMLIAVGATVTIGLIMESTGALK